MQPSPWKSLPSNTATLRRFQRSTRAGPGGAPSGTRPAPRPLGPPAAAAPGFTAGRPRGAPPPPPGKGGGGRPAGGAAPFSRAAPAGGGAPPWPNRAGGDGPVEGAI